MAAFKFRLASVLRYRERVKEEKQWELGSLNETRSNIERHMGELEESLRSASESLTAQTGRILTVLELRLQGDYTQQIAAQIRQEHNRLRAVEQKLADKRDELIAADRAVKSMELLRNRFAERVRREQATEEQKLGDEIAHRKFVDLRARKNFPH